jgi:hypothetical protein
LVFFDLDIRRIKSLVCKFVSPLDVQALPGQINSQSKQQMINSLKGEYIKWRQSSKTTLRRLEIDISVGRSQIFDLDFFYFQLRVMKSNVFWVM